MMRIPEHGMDRETLFEKMESYRAEDVDWKKGRTFGYVYDAGEAAYEVCKEAYLRFLSENALDFTVYPSLLRLENDIIAMAASHLGGDDRVAGTFTSGGTESIVLAVKSAREWARAERPHITHPEMVLPVTAHAAHHKAARYLGIEVIEVDVDPDTYKADPDAIRAAITENTILLVASAPSYAHGVVDPIAEIGQIALAHLPYFRRLGAPIPDFDLRVPGVTSISMDLHKYGFAAKGASVVLYRDKAMRTHQFFSCSRWTGYTVINPTVQSSRTGGPLAAAWAVLNFIGDDGYLEIARGLRDATLQLAEGVAAIDGLELMAPPEMCLFAFSSDTVNVFHLADEMGSRGWYIQPQLRYRDSQENIHLSVNPGNIAHVEPFLADLRASVEAVRGLPSGQLAAIAGQLTDLVEAGMSEAEFANLMAMVGVGAGEVPGK
ncbi:MAG: aspartate aminotransferase family protein, partial [Deltaproteobacteria bacterium]|nr:aspartate aminotransferase family protein [Deltaproteobacteria bacterium]